MCLVTAYLVGGGGEPLLEEVTYMQLDGDHVQIVNFSGEKKVIQGRVIEVDFSLRHCYWSSTTPPLSKPRKRRVNT